MKSGCAAVSHSPSPQLFIFLFSLNRRLNFSFFIIHFSLPRVLLSIVIVSYNVHLFLEQCLRSVFAARGTTELEVFVVDNASDDDTPQFLRERFPAEQYPELHIEANTRNVGFGRANNQVIERAQGRYVLFLNPDTVLTEETLTRCLDFAQQHDDLGALGVMMLQSNGSFAYESRRGIPTPWTAFCKMSGLASLFPRSHRFGRYYMRYLDAEQATPIDIVSGAFMMCPREVLLKHGAFDPQFFMYGEDIDLSYRLLRAGLQNYYVPTPILHYKGESTHKNTYRYVHVFYGAMLLFFRKHYRHYAWWFSLPIKGAILGKALIELAKNQARSLRNFLLPSREQRTSRNVYVGRHAADVLSLGQQNGFDIVCVETDEAHFRPEQLAAQLPPDCVHIIFDAANFSYAFVLNYFRRTDHRHHIGLYYPDTHTLTTGGCCVTGK